VKSTASRKESREETEEGRERGGRGRKEEGEKRMGRIYIWQRREARVGTEERDKRE